MPDVPTITISGMTAAWIVREAAPFVLRKLFRKSPHKTFADDPDKYWNRMRETVTEPLSVVLDKQTDAMQKILLELAEQRGRRKR